jgi:hypothetical protein
MFARCMFGLDAGDKFDGRFRSDRDMYYPLRCGGEI